MNQNNTCWIHECRQKSRRGTSNPANPAIPLRIRRRSAISAQNQRLASIERPQTSLNTDPEPLFFRSLPLLSRSLCFSRNPRYSTPDLLSHSSCLRSLCPIRRSWSPHPTSTRFPWTKQPMAADKDPSVRNVLGVANLGFACFWVHFVLGLLADFGLELVVLSGWSCLLDYELKFMASTWS
ncbi:hypothetical protein MA16_Dca024553 [Dendrobium catenatum]|uniref:Uncharacterized protein n=1 Tax=Dendrobium catenatum TaxID=906689 RepID=A0A2I0WE39_9ASPA|nr:hypothetical protein MA16_Dca024553 [Dendrobium catenatum]